MTHCPHALDDGAYVLGALSPSERAEYERHLGGCPSCREAVAEIAVLPGLLGRLADPDALDLSVTGPPPDRMPALLTAVGAERRRVRRVRRRRYAGAALVAAALAAVVGVGVSGYDAGWFGGRSGAGQVAGRGGQSADTLVSMQPVDGQVPVTAEVGMHGTNWGTEISMRCTYKSGGDRTKSWTFRLVAHGADGAKEQVGSWMAGAGETVSLNGATRFTGRELVRLELTRYDGTPLLAYDVP
ncbi:zf-HC2 domain-containing protein [Asanoa sp. WMMD1127]|uniref:anti-sigma factor family protein n=1 Tax=Asanoa sp. WMMD1127 TaxID=3016107 RepID=UPI0024165222|nr:zf-HC2 domain-containing protein [Asanoa sp. WMMD1127]MDG4821597.1 zf-HC2 domain-containing protein [Asanoa sp. WMMD1127]